MFVVDVDDTCARALKAGAMVVTQPGEEMRRQIREPGCAEAMRVAQETFHAEGSGRSSRPVPPAPNPGPVPARLVEPLQIP